MSFLCCDLSLDFCAVFEGYGDVVCGVDSDEINHRDPVLILEFCQQVFFPKVLQEEVDLLTADVAYNDLVGGLRVTHLEVLAFIGKRLKACIVALLIEDVVGIVADFASLKPFSDAPFVVLRDASCFLLGERCKDGKHQFAVSAQSVYGLFFESDLGAFLFQMSDSVQKVNGVPGNSLNGIGEDDVDFSLLTV